MNQNIIDYFNYNSAKITLKLITLKPKYTLTLLGECIIDLKPLLLHERIGFEDNLEIFQDISLISPHF